MNTDIGIEKNNRKELCAGLSRALADTYVLYAKTQFYHWNVTGPFFHSLHGLFETQYTELAAQVDDLAERIRALGFPTVFGLGQFLKGSDLDDARECFDGLQMVELLAHDRESLIQSLRSIIAFADEVNDQGTADLLTGQLESHEKAAWMLRSHLDVSGLQSAVRQAV